MRSGPVRPSREWARTSLSSGSRFRRALGTVVRRGGHLARRRSLQQQGPEALAPAVPERSRTNDAAELGPPPAWRCDGSSVRLPPARVRSVRPRPPAWWPQSRLCVQFAGSPRGSIGQLRGRPVRPGPSTGRPGSARHRDRCPTRSRTRRLSRLARVRPSRTRRARICLRARTRDGPSPCPPGHEEALGSGHRWMGPEPTSRWSHRWPRLRQPPVAIPFVLPCRGAVRSPLAGTVRPGVHLMSRLPRWSGRLPVVTPCQVAHRPARRPGAGLLLLVIVGLSLRAPRSPPGGASPGASRTKRRSARAERPRSWRDRGVSRRHGSGQGTQPLRPRVSRLALRAPSPFPARVQVRTCLQERLVRSRSGTQASGGPASIAGGPS